MSKRCSFKVDKLIRDKLPEIMRLNNIIVFERVMEHDEYIKRLKDKLLEETKEVIEAKTKGDIKEELADLLEIIHAFGSINGLSFQDIEDTRIKKKEEKGGFEKRIYNAFVGMDYTNESIEYYRARPDEYPEIK